MSQYIKYISECLYVHTMQTQGMKYVEINVARSLHSTMYVYVCMMYCIVKKLTVKILMNCLIFTFDEKY